jgi:hypothetical protein
MHFLYVRTNERGGRKAVANGLECGGREARVQERFGAGVQPFGTCTELIEAWEKVLDESS